MYWCSKPAVNGQCKRGYNPTSGLASNELRFDLDLICMIWEWLVSNTQDLYFYWITGYISRMTSDLTWTYVEFLEMRLDLSLSWITWDRTWPVKINLKLNLKHLEWFKGPETWFRIVLSAMLFNIDMSEMTLDLSHREWFKSTLTINTNYFCLWWHLFVLSVFLDQQLRLQLLSVAFFISSFLAITAHANHLISFYLFQAIVEVTINVAGYFLKAVHLTDPPPPYLRFLSVWVF